MNFIQDDYDKTMKDGSLVLLYESHESIDYCFLSAGTILNNKFGAFHHNDFIGQKFGSKIYSKFGSGWIIAVEPNPELWSIALHTRTQIVDELDSSIICMHMDLFPGCVVVESGTGSGSLSMGIARCIAPMGHLYTYEYNSTRATMAAEEFERLGVSHLVSVHCRDVCGKGSDEGGFPLVPGIGAATITESTAGEVVKHHTVEKVDAVFLDLPEPWLAIPHAKQVLKPGRSICCYSPCMGQVTRACETLRQLGFHSIHMIEVRQRPHDARRYSAENVDIGLPLKMNDSHDIGVTNEEEEKVTSETCGVKNDESEEPVYKKRMLYVPKIMAPTEVLVARPVATMKGHTAFLTFAVAPWTDADGNKASTVETKDPTRSADKGI